MTEQLEELQLAVSTDKVRAGATVCRRNVQSREASTASAQAALCGTGLEAPLLV